MELVRALQRAGAPAGEQDVQRMMHLLRSGKGVSSAPTSPNTVSFPNRNGSPSSDAPGVGQPTLPPRGSSDSISYEDFRHFACLLPSAQVRALCE